VVTQELQGDDVKESLQTVDSPWNADCLDVIQKFGGVIVVADDHGGCLSCGDLRKGGFDFGKERIPGHHDDDWHVLVDQGKGAVFKFPGEDT